jgi:hypothetical protein
MTKYRLSRSAELRRLGRLARRPILAAPIILGVVALGLSFGRARAEDCPHRSSYLAIEAPVKDRTGPQVGRGAYSYRFVVRDPRQVGRPYRHGRYQITLADPWTFPDGTPFYLGRTDALGRTVTFRFPRPIAEDEAWSVWPLVGRGQLGESMLLQIDGDQTCISLAGWNYLIDEVMGPVFCGKALPNGMTVRYMTPKPSSIRVFTDFSAYECRMLRRAVNPVMAGRSLRDRLTGLRALAASPRMAAFSDLLAGKIEALRCRYATIAELRRDLELQLRNAPLESHADILNHMGYCLLDQDPPRLVSFAAGLLDRSLALGEDRYNTDSKAWSLHFQRRDKEALDWVDRSLSRFGHACSESERSALQDTLAHRGVILWSLDRKAEALEDWAQAFLLDDAGGWTNALPDWSTVEAGIKTRAQQLQADKATTPLCRVIGEAPESAQNEAPPRRHDAGAPLDDASVPDAVGSDEASAAPIPSQ